MGLREFRDGDGILWQVWSVTAEVLDKRTAAEDYMRDWQDGWLCFEHAGARRRLADFPANWEQLSDQALIPLLQKAQAVKPRRPGSTSGEYAQFSNAGPPSAGAAGAERQVVSPQPDGLADSSAPDRRASSLGGEAPSANESARREAEQSREGPTQ